MIYLIITSYGEVNATEQAIKAALKQTTKSPYKIIISDPFDETRWMIEEKFPKEKRIEYIADEGKGKSHALNKLLKTFNKKNDLIVMTDGDVYISSNAIEEIERCFKDPIVACVCGKPTTLNQRNTLFGYWSHAAFDEFNRTRKAAAQKKEFFEVSGYLFAIRAGILDAFPSGASEDNVIPLMLWEKGYAIAYAEKAEVYVLNPQNFKEWLAQKKRNIKGHLALKHLPLKIPRRKNTIFAEARRGARIMLAHPKSIKEFVWLFLMALGRLCAWMLAIVDVKIRRKGYKDGWREEVELATTRPLDE